MKRRDFSLAATAATAAVGGLALPAAHAQAPRPPQAGSEYLVLKQRAPVEAPAGRIEVVEFFWYSCPHCNAFEPRLEAWVKNLPAGVSFRRSHVAFNDSFVPQQKLFAALETLGKVEEMQSKVFRAIHVERQPLNREAAIIDWVAAQGIDKAKFTEAYNSFTTASKVRKATQLQDAYAVEGVPALGVAGRYYTDGSHAGGMERALQIVEFLVGEARKAG